MITETFFVSHGSPTLSIDDSLPAGHLLKAWKQNVYPHTPNSVLVISAHWETHVPTVNIISPPKANDTIHDFITFPNPCTRYEDVNNYLEKAPNPKMAHSWPEHFYPLHVALGVAGDKAKAKLIHHSWTDASLSYASYQFTAPH